MPDSHTKLSTAHAVGDSALAGKLRRAIKGDVLFDAASRGRYSTDASIYQIEPIGVVVPRDDEDVRAALAVAREERLPVLPRGGGTSQCGQTVGAALVIDGSKHLDRIVAFDKDARTVTVEFVTTVNGGKPWTFAAEQPRLQVQPGKLYTVAFTAQNTQDHAVIAQAVPSVAPWNAAKHLKKTECFCFRQQPFAAGEKKEMPMRFMLDPELPADVDTVTLSYTFFDVTEVAHR